VETRLSSPTARLRGANAIPTRPDDGTTADLKSLHPKLDITVGNTKNKRRRRRSRVSTALRKGELFQETTTTMVAGIVPTIGTDSTAGRIKAATAGRFRAVMVATGVRVRAATAGRVRVATAGRVRVAAAPSRPTGLDTEGPKMVDTATAVVLSGSGGPPVQQEPPGIVDMITELPTTGGSSGRQGLKSA
jgi:hypothetical protein